MTPHCYQSYKCLDDISTHTRELELETKQKCDNNEKRDELCLVRDSDFELSIEANVAAQFFVWFLYFFAKKFRETASRSSSSANGTPDPDFFLLDKVKTKEDDDDGLGAVYKKTKYTLLFPLILSII